MHVNVAPSFSYLHDVEMAVDAASTPKGLTERNGKSALSAESEAKEFATM